MIVTVDKGKDLGKVIEAGQKALKRVYGDNVEVVWKKISDRRAKARLWVKNPDGPGARFSVNGRRLHSASWVAHGVAILAWLKAGATRVETAMAVYRSEKDFWEKAPDAGRRNIGSRISPYLHAWTSIDPRERRVGREPLVEAAWRAGLEV